MVIEGEEPFAGKKSDAWVVSGSENGKVVIWELSSRQIVQVLAEGGHRSPVVALAVSGPSPRGPGDFARADDQVSPDGRTMATGSLEPEKILHIWHDSS
jgi:COMPASS component SWD3